MPTIYLSPSTRENIFFIGGGSEEEWMNRLADAMVPYLVSTGIQYTRSAPDMTTETAILQSNEGNYDLYLALHSNIAPENLSGSLRGLIVYYYPGSVKGKRAAEIIATNLKSIYPLPDRVRVNSRASIAELRDVKAPSVFLGLGYRDNPDDEAWLTGNLDLIARTIVHALADYFGISFLLPMPPRAGVVDITSGYLNIRSRPNLNAPVIAKAYDGTRLTVLNESNGWYLVQLDGVVGYGSSNYITLV